MAEQDETRAREETAAAEETPLDAVEAPPEAEATEPAQDWEQTAKERYDQLLRLRADFENFRRRVDRDREELTVQITGSVLASMLPVYDNLDRALKLIPDQGETHSWRVGIEMTLKGFEEALGRMGVEPIAAVGQSFDPNLHEAVAREESSEPEGTILEELVKGFRWRDRVIRASLVKVSSGEEDRGSGFDA